MEVIDPLEFASTITDAYTNKPVGQLNDHVIRLSIMTLPYDWHYHPNSDETFIGSAGILVVETEKAAVELSAGMAITISKGILHRTRPKGERSVNLTIEHAAIETVFVY
ncbi:cupin domain-containing protein [Mucilaginibacter pedocola]|uniref:Cupin n=1 Tax=Mucilaginibacter pedocola TaxID=1792845 RepID=A0A1S9PKR0_9SPHI|nr:cupin domain-containing protein [Mucilaginibacter pedocola]OOQ61540.1 cupin [Mucilaginibacter pedocola]